MSKGLPLLRVKDGRIVDEAGRRVMLRGVALGGWLLMEGYFLHGRNIPEREFKALFEKTLGAGALSEFTKAFRDTFIREEDIRLIKSWGANCVRVPFNYRVVELEDTPDKPNAEGLGYLDRVVEWCGEHGLYCILDMHAAPGAQNVDWHADCSGKPELFTDPKNMDRFVRLWRFLAERYKGKSAIAGYDLLNEPVVEVEREGVVKSLYERATREIRAAGDKHIIFLEGNIWGQRLEFIGRPDDENTAYSIHAYPPTEFTFNLIRDLKYPCTIHGIKWDKNTLAKMTVPYRELSKRNKMPIYVGEFGVNARGGYANELVWVKDMLDIFKANDLSWTYWTYKTVANAIEPDGIFRYLKNPAWVKREGPVTGWETWPALWPRQKREMIESWKTGHFEPNKALLDLLKKYW